MESLTVTWPQRRMMVLQKKGKIMIWRNGQTTHPSLHLHLLAQETVRKLVSNENGHRLQLKRRARDRSMATRGLQGPGLSGGSGLGRDALEAHGAHQRLHSDKDWRMLSDRTPFTPGRDGLRVFATLVKVLVYKAGCSVCKGST